MRDEFKNSLRSVQRQFVHGAQEYIAVIPDMGGLCVDVAGGVSAARRADEEMVPCQNFVAVFIPLITAGGADSRLMSQKNILDRLGLDISGECIDNRLITFRRGSVKVPDGFDFVAVNGDHTAHRFDKMAAAGAVKFAPDTIDGVCTSREGIKVKVPEFIRVEIDTVKCDGVLGHRVEMSQELFVKVMEWHDSHKRSPF